jgi:hypothetical protein
VCEWGTEETDDLRRVVEVEARHENDHWLAFVDPLVRTHTNGSNYDARNKVADDDSHSESRVDAWHIVVRAIERKLTHRQAMAVRTLAFAKAGLEILPLFLGTKIWASVRRH